MLAKNKPVLHVDIDLKSLIYEAYHKGADELLYVVPFVAKIIESAIKSRVKYLKHYLPVDLVELELLFVCGDWTWAFLVVCLSWLVVWGEGLYSFIPVQIQGQGISFFFQSGKLIVFEFGLSIWFE